MGPEAAFPEDAPPFRRRRSLRAAPPAARRCPVQRAAFHDAVRHDVATQDTPENIDKDAPGTCGSESMIENPAATVSSLAPPPASRKSAGSAPACLMASIVAIASPGPVHQRTDGTAQPNIGEPLFGGGALQPIALPPLSLRAAISGCRFSALSSKFILASNATNPPPSLRASGLISSLGHILFGGKGRQPLAPAECQFPRRALDSAPPALQQVPGLKRPQVVASVQPGRERPAPARRPPQPRCPCRRPAKP